MAKPRAFTPRFESLETRDVPTFLGNNLFPADNPWNQRVADAPVAANSAAIINRIDARTGGAGPYLHADFSNPATVGGFYGIPVTVVDGSTPKVNVVIPAAGYAGESDLVPVPIPAAAKIEGDYVSGPAPASARGDSHLLVYDKTANVGYELYQAARPADTSYPYGGSKPAGVWGAYQVSVWDYNANTFRQVGKTSADAAGLPILPGLARPDEANPAAAGGQGAITHALRVTVKQTLNQFVYPASHAASSLTAADLPRMGERFRLKSSFVVPTTWSPEAKAIATAMKEYGLIVADNGSDLFFGGTPSDQWAWSNVRQVQAIPATAFEVVDLAPRVTGLGAATGPAGGGTSVTVTGQNFGGAGGRLAVLFGGTPAASVTIQSDTQLVAVAPAGAAGVVDVVVRSGKAETNANNQSVFWGYGTSPAVAADRFTYTAANTAPTIAAVADQTVTANGTTGPVAFAVADAETPAGLLVVTAVSSDLLLVPVVGIGLGGSGASRTVTLTPLPGRSGTATVTLTVLDAGGLTATRAFTLTVTPTPVNPAAAFVGTDRTTQGSWVGTYGSAGYALAVGPASLPAGTAVTPARAYDSVSATTTADPRGLELPGGGRKAAAWASYKAFTVAVDQPAGVTRRVSVYLLDWDRAGRTETVEVLDPATGAMLDTRTASDFGEGVYLTWQVTGAVVLRFTKTGPGNGVVSGVFLD